MAPVSPIDIAQSVAGEEDPGASVEVAPGTAAQGASTGQPAAATPTPPAMSPGDQAPPGTPGTGETVCPACGGTGRLSGRTCPDCNGTGRITVGIGGA